MGTADPGELLSLPCEKLLLHLFMNDTLETACKPEFSLCSELPGPQGPSQFQSLGGMLSLDSLLSIVIREALGLKGVIPKRWSSLGAECPPSRLSIPTPTSPGPGLKQHPRLAFQTKAADFPKFIILGTQVWSNNLCTEGHLRDRQMRSRGKRLGQVTVT